MGLMPIEDFAGVSDERRSGGYLILNTHGRRLSGALP
jgi:hypothetical protein